MEKLNLESLESLAVDFISNCEKNIITEKNALSKKYAGIKLLDEPIFACASASDPLFAEFQKKDVIGEYHKLPTDWLPSAKTVISFFCPFTEEVRADNAKDMNSASIAWMHARIEGQQTISELCTYLVNKFEEAGHKTVCPMQSNLFSAMVSTKKKTNTGMRFSSNWSERHAAFAAGLGTFGLSKGLITKKGVAGRFGSIVTELEIPPTARDYEEIYDYCTNCGKCVHNCPANAITLTYGKIHAPCAAFVDKTEEENYPYYGCGKCQVSVPCELKIPVKNI